MPQNEAPINIPPVVLTEVNTKLNEIVSALAPYLTSLSDQDRKRMAKMSDKTVAFLMPCFLYQRFGCVVQRV